MIIIRRILRFIALSSVFIASQTTYSENTERNASIVREARGVMEYRVISTGKVTGSEEFHLTVHPDGSRTIEARNRTDSYGLQRHVTHRVAKDFRPLETTAVYWMQGEWRGTGLFAVNGNKLKAMVKTPEGIIMQEADVPEHFSFVPHPLSTNAWHGWYYDKKKGGKQSTTWYDMDAAAAGPGSMLGKFHTQELEHLGIKKITTPAGDFEADHFQVGTVDYFTTGPDSIMVKFMWESADREYILTEFETSDGTL